MSKKENHLFIQLDSLVKTKEKLSREYIEERWVGSYIIKRMLTGVSNDISVLKDLIPYINNLDCSNIEDPWYEYLFLYYTLPKLENCNFYFYVSKPKNPKLNDQNISFVAEALEISKKESKYLIENNYINL